MSVRGGLGTRGLWAAAAPSRGIALALLMLAPGLLLLAAPSEAQSASDPWWGPSDRNDPTVGYAVRIPIVVENTRLEFVRDPIVTVDIDFGKLLVKAGWTNRTAGTDTTLRGFTLDVNSIRVLEYQRGFVGGPVGGSQALPVPHRFYTAPFEAERTREFDAQRNPSGTLMFRIPGFFEREGKRFFYVYANPLEYEKQPSAPATFPLQELAPIDSFGWGTTGQVFYGFEPAQEGQAHQIEVRSLDTAQPTKVEVFQADLGRFAPVAATSTYANPQTLQGDRAAGTFFVPANKPYKIVADRPVVVMAHGALVPPVDNTPTQETGPGGKTDWRGYIPSLTGSYAGTAFWVYGGSMFSTPAGRPSVKMTVILAGDSGAATVQTSHSSVTLTAAEPIREVSVNYAGWTFVQSSAPILLFMGDTLTSTSPYWGHQVPSRTGGPTGREFLTTIPYDGGYVRICPSSEDAAVRLVDFDRQQAQLAPEGPVSTTPPLSLTKGTMCQVAAGTTAFPRDAPVLAYSVKQGAAEAGRFMLESAAKKRVLEYQERPFIGHYGGEGGTRFHTEGRVGVFGFYNDTRVTVFVERERNGERFVTNQTFAVSTDGFQPFDPLGQFPDATGVLTFVSTKPISVVSLEPTGNTGYAYFVPGRPISPKTILGNAEFRGPLVDLRSREKEGRQDVRSTGPGSPITFPLEVINLGHWIAGESLSDTITLTCTGLQGWTVEHCDRQVTLTTGNAERVDVTITPPPDALNTKGVIVVEARSKFGNVVSKFELHTFVEIRYGVGLWFDVEGGRKTIDPAIGVDPGETYRYAVVIKNTGSAPDLFDLTVEPDARPGWAQALLLEGEPVKELALASGETRVLTFAVTAPNAEAAQQNIVSISAQSTRSALAGDVVNTATRIRPKVSISMTLDPATRVTAPNETGLFNITVTNTGNDIFLVQLAREGLLPVGWNASFNLEPPEINLNPNPGRDPNLSYTFQLRVTPPLGSRAGDLATFKITAQVDSGGGTSIPGDEATAVVVVRKIHNVTAPPLLDARAEPGQALDYVLPVTNHGNGNDVIELLAGATTPDWDVTTDAPPVALGVDEAADIPLRIQVPPLTLPGLYNLTFTLRLSREAFQNLTIPIDVRPTPRLAYVGNVDLSFPPGRAYEARLFVENTGNLAGAFALVADAPEGWNVTLLPPRVTLAPGERAPVAVRVNATRDAPDATYDLALRATLDEADAGATRGTVTLARPDLRITSIDASGSARPGELVLVAATVQNVGGIAAENVSVALVVDGEAVDQVVLARIPGGDAKIATLSWVSTKRTDDIRVVLDPADEIVEATATGDDAQVVFSSKLVPGPGILLLAGAVGATALALRNSRRSRP